MKALKSPLYTLFAMMMLVAASSASACGDPDEVVVLNLPDPEISVNEEDC